MIRLAALWLVACLVLPAAAAPPPRVELSFDIMMGGMRVGQAREVLEHDGRRYRVVSESAPRGIAALLIGEVRRESRGTVTPGGLRPEQFDETGRRGGARGARFDWAGEKLTLTGREGSVAVPLPPGTLDQASLAYSLAFKSAPGASFSVHVTDGRGVKQYRYRELAPEILKTPLGEIRTRHFEKVREPGERRGFDFWLAVDRHLLPVKLRYVEKNGDAFDSVITDIKFQ